MKRHIFSRLDFLSTTNRLRVYWIDLTIQLAKIKVTGEWRVTSFWINILYRIAHQRHRRKSQSWKLMTLYKIFTSAISDNIAIDIWVFRHHWRIIQQSFLTAINLNKKRCHSTDAPTNLAPALGKYFAKDFHVNFTMTYWTTFINPKVLSKDVCIIQCIKKMEIYVYCGDEASLTQHDIFSLSALVQKFIARSSLGV